MAKNQSNAPAIDDDPFSAPGKSEFVDWSEINGELVVIIPEEFVKGVPTIHGENDAIRADMYVLTGDNAGQEYEGTMIFGRSVIPQLKKKIDELVLCRIAQGPKQKGKSPAWRLDSEISAEDKALGMKWYKARQDSDPFSDADDDDE